MKKFCLLGGSTSGSLSPLLHSILGKFCGIKLQYDLVDLTENNFIDEFNRISLSYDGINITSPFKQLIARHIECGNISSVNTVCVNPVRGLSTDGVGVVDALRGKGAELNNAKVLVIGCGGSAISVINELINCHCCVTIVNRTYSSAQAVASQFNISALKSVNNGHYDIICSCIPATTSLVCIDEQTIGNAKYCLDVEYKRLTIFSSLAKNSNAIYVSGKEMLFYQGVASFEKWNKMQIDRDKLSVLLQEFLVKSEVVE